MLTTELLQLAARLRREGRVPEAIRAYEQLLSVQPQLPDSWYNLGLLLRRSGRHDEALSCYQTALQLGIRQPEEVHLNRALIFSDHLARSESAETELTLALQLNPRYVPAWLNLGNLHEDHGRRPEARAAYERALALDPGNSLALSRLPQVSKVSGPDDALIGQLQRALDRPGLSAAERADLGFGLGKALDDAAAYDRAFAAYAQANRDSRRSGGEDARYDREAHEALIDRLIRVFPGPPAATRQEAAADGDPPIFICGMFRSGSTLAEQILARRPQVVAGGELELLPALQARYLQPFPEAFQELDGTRRGEMASRYLAGIRQLFPGHHRVTDKRPDNFLNIGLIKALFPTAKIVHTRRNPLDNCLSIYFLHLGQSMPYALDLLEIAHWFRQHRRLMSHWQSIYGDDILELDYDELVSSPEATIRNLLDYCELDWDESCLDFHQAANAVRTASVWQVREPLYQRSSGRWQNYAAHLGPLQAALSAP